MSRSAIAPVLTSQNAPLFVRYVRERGGDVDGVLRRFGLPSSAGESRELRLPVTTLQALGDACAAATRDPFFGVSVAGWAPRGAFGLVEFCCRSAPTLGDAIERLVRYQVLLNDVDRLHFERGERELRLRFTVPGYRLCWGRHFNECSLALFTRVAREASNGRFTAEQVWLAHPEPPRSRRLHDLFGTSRLTFDAGMNGMAVHDNVLAAPLVSADDALLRILDDEAGRRLGEQPPPDDFLGKIHNLLRREIAAGATIDRVASELHMSARTLQRRLAQRGATFQRLVDEVRQASASTLLEGAGRPIKSVAAALGYADARSFTRAYKRWRGATPGGARRSRPV